MIRRPPRSTLSSSSAASDVYKRQVSTQSTGGGRLVMSTSSLYLRKSVEAAWRDHTEVQVYSLDRSSVVRCQLTPRRPLPISPRRHPQFRRRYVKGCPETMYRRRLPKLELLDRLEESVTRAVELVKQSRMCHPDDRVQVAREMFELCIDKSPVLRSLLCLVKGGYERTLGERDRQLAAMDDHSAKLNGIQNLTYQEAMELEQHRINEKKRAAQMAQVQLQVAESERCEEARRALALQRDEIEAECANLLRSLERRVVVCWSGC
eukprot:TRINITY_DN12359_c0_g1_i1.p1 TRINITY_DN12359_c0_g1~~TRINITY_DN12359_c0_g1_i1.p1  ORF type:complete len:264 (-),score=48.31 TRINITY_DN12359_c0_g1_i1:507-1298(-)